MSAVLIATDTFQLQSYAACHCVPDRFLAISKNYNSLYSLLKPSK